MPVTRITIRGVDQDVADNLRAYAEEHGLTLGDCLNEAIGAWLDGLAAKAEDEADASFDRHDERFREMQRLLDILRGDDHTSSAAGA